MFLGKSCARGHIHLDGKTFRNTSNATCCQCADERIASWSKTPAGIASRAATKARRVDKRRLRDKAYRQEKKAHLAAYNAKYIAENPGWVKAYFTAYNARRRAKELKATPSWADQVAIAGVYERAAELTTLTGVRHDVDHIVPLQSPLVCGLHVEHNLRPLPRSENSSKGNRWWPNGPFDAPNNELVGISEGGHSGGIIRAHSVTI